MIKFILVCGLIGCAYAGVIGLGSGVSTQTRTQDAVGNYAFAYDESHPSGGSFRQESGNGLGHVTGSYGLRDADGRNRIVHYIADDLGYRASILTNEPGVEPKSPASVSINGGAPSTLVAAPAALPLAQAPLPFATRIETPFAKTVIA